MKIVRYAVLWQQVSKHSTIGSIEHDYKSFDTAFSGDWCQNADLSTHFPPTNKIKTNQNKLVLSSRNFKKVERNRKARIRITAECWQWHSQSSWDVKLSEAIFSRTSKHEMTDKAHIRIEWVKGKVEESDTFRFIFALHLTRRRNGKILWNQKHFYCTRGYASSSSKNPRWVEDQLEKLKQNGGGKRNYSEKLSKTPLTEAGIKSQNNSPLMLRCKEIWRDCELR